MRNTVKYDCFAKRMNRCKNKEDLKFKGCRVLTEMICLERECPFYKTKEEYVYGLDVIKGR